MAQKRKVGAPTQKKRELNQTQPISLGEARGIENDWEPGMEGRMTRSQAELMEKLAMGVGPASLNPIAGSGAHAAKTMLQGIMQKLGLTGQQGMASAVETLGLPNLGSMHNTGPKNAANLKILRPRTPGQYVGLAEGGDKRFGDIVEGDPTLMDRFGSDRSQVDTIIDKLSSFLTGGKGGGRPPKLPPSHEIDVSDEALDAIMRDIEHGGWAPPQTSLSPQSRLRPFDSDLSTINNVMGDLENVMTSKTPRRSPEGAFPASAEWGGRPFSSDAHTRVRQAGDVPDADIIQLLANLFTGKR